MCCTHSLLTRAAFLPNDGQRVSEPCLPVNRSTGRSGIFDPEIALKTLTWGRGGTPPNRPLIETYAQRRAEVCSFQNGFLSSLGVCR